MIFKKPEVVKKKEKLLFAHRILNDRIHSLDAIRQDSLVTKSLLDLTSYETKNEEPVEDDSFDQFDDVQHPLSFDDLGKIIINSCTVTQCTNRYVSISADISVIGRYIGFEDIENAYQYRLSADMNAYIGSLTNIL